MLPERQRRVYHRFEELGFTADTIDDYAVGAFICLFATSTVVLVLEGLVSMGESLHIDRAVLARKHPYIVERMVHSILAHALGAMLFARMSPPHAYVDAGYVENTWHRLRSRFPYAYAYTKLALAFVVTMYGMLQTLYVIKQRDLP